MRYAERLARAIREKDADNLAEVLDGLQGSYAARYLLEAMNLEGQTGTDAVIRMIDDTMPQESDGLSFDVPNLTDADENDLLHFALTLDKLAMYARIAVSAKRKRSAGKIELALAEERDKEAIYKSLPEWAKW